MLFSQFCHQPYIYYLGSIEHEIMWKNSILPSYSKFKQFGVDSVCAKSLPALAECALKSIQRCSLGVVSVCVKIRSAFMCVS
jgi:hypothetical protein